MARNLVAGGNIVIIKKSGEDGSKYPVAAGSITIGRGAECDFKILRKDVAIVQCTISIYRNFATITNCSDEFPTLVNNESIDSKVLKHDDILAISNRSFRWEYTQPNAVRTKIPMKAASSGAKKMPFQSASVPKKRKSVNTTYTTLPKRVNTQIERLLESKGRYSLNELPSSILKLRSRHSVGAGSTGSSQENKVRQIAVVKPQRRSAEVNATSAANGKAADAVPAPLPTEDSPRTTDRSSSANQPRFVTRPHRGKSLSPPKNLSAKGKQKRASLPSSARAAKAKGSTVVRSTPKRAASLVKQPTVVGTSGKPIVEKVIEPDTIDEHKKAALMLLTGRSPVKKQQSTPAPLAAKAPPKSSIRTKVPYTDTPRPKNVPSLPSSSKGTPAVAKKTQLPSSSAKRAPFISTVSAKKSPKRGLFQTPAPKAGSAVGRITRMTPASSAKKTLPKSAVKKSSTTFIFETPSSSNRSTSGVGLKSAMKSPESKRRSDRIKFDLSNLEEDLLPASPAPKTPVPQKSGHSTPHPNTGHRVVYSRKKMADGSLPLFNLSDSELDLESVSDIEPLEMVHNEDRRNSTFSIRASTNSSLYNTADSMRTSLTSKRRSTSTSGTPAKILKLSTTSKRVSKTPGLAVVNDVSLNTPDKTPQKTTPEKKSPRLSGYKSPKLSLGELFNTNFKVAAVSTPKRQSSKESTSKNRTITKSASKSLSTSNSRLSLSAVESPKLTLTVPERQSPKGSASKNRSIGKSPSKSNSAEGSTSKRLSNSKSRLSLSAVKSPKLTLTVPKRQSPKGSTSKNRSIGKSASKSFSTSNSRLSLSAVESPKLTLTVPERQSPKGSASKNRSIGKSPSKSNSAEGSTSKRLSNSKSRLSLSAVKSPKLTLTVPKRQSPKGSTSKNRSIGKSASKSLFTSNSRISLSAVESPKLTLTIPKGKSPKGSSSKTRSIGKLASNSQSAGSTSKSHSTSNSRLSLSNAESPELTQTLPKTQSPKGPASKNQSIGKLSSKRQSAEGSTSKSLSTSNSRLSRSAVKSPKLTLTIVHSRIQNSPIDISDTSGTEDGITTPSISILFEPKSSTPKPNKRTSIRNAIEHFQLLTTPEQMHSAKKSGRKTIDAIRHLQKRKSNNLFTQSERKNRSFQAIGLRRTRGSENLHVSSSDASTSSNVTDTNAPKPRLETDEIITPKSTLKLKPEQVREKHSTAKKNRVSRKSFIDHMNDSTDNDVRDLFTIPVKRKLSQSIGHFDISDLANDSLVSVNFSGVELLQTSRRSEEAAYDDDVRYSLPPTVAVQGKEKHSTAKKNRVSRTSFIDHMKDSTHTFDLTDDSSSSANFSGVELLQTLRKSEEAADDDDVRYSLPPTVAVRSMSPESDEEPRYSLPPTTPVSTVKSSKAVPEEDEAEEDIRYSLPALQPEANSVETDESESPKKTTQKSPRNNLTDVSGVKQLLRTPTKTPKNDLTNVASVKKLFKTPDKSVPLNLEVLYSFPPESPKKITQKSPRNDLTNVSGVKRLLRTPAKPPKNDLTNVAGVKRLLQTPGRKQKSPKNDLTNVAGVKKLLKTPGKSQISPKNDLTNVAGVKNLLKTPGRLQKSPRNDLTNVTGIKQLMKSPDKPQKSPKNDLTKASGLKRLFKSPAVPQKSPRNDLSDVRGVRALFKSPKARAGHGDANHASIGNLFESHNSNSLFDSLLDKPTLRTYSRNTTMDTQSYHNRSTVTIGEKRKSGDDQPRSPKKSPKKPKLSGTPMKGKEINNLFIDMNVESSPSERRRSKNESLHEQDKSLPIKKRILLRTNNLLGHSTPLRNETPDKTGMEQSRVLSPIAFPEKFTLQTEVTTKRTAKTKRGAVAEAIPAERKTRGRKPAVAVDPPKSPKVNPKAEHSKPETSIPPKKVTFSEKVHLSNVETEKIIEKPKPRGRRAAKQEVVVSPKAEPTKRKARAPAAKTESPKAEEPARKSRRRGKAASPQQTPKEKPAATGRGKKTAKATPPLKADDKSTNVKATLSPAKPAAKGKAKAAAAKSASSKPARTLRGRAAAPVEADLSKSPKAAASRSKKAAKAAPKVSQKTPSPVTKKPTRSRSKAAVVESPKAPTAKATKSRKKAEEKTTKSPPARKVVTSKPAAMKTLKIVISRMSTSKIASTPKGKGLPRGKKATATQGTKKAKKELQIEEVQTKSTKRATAPRGKTAGAKEQSKVKVAVKDLSYKKSPAAARTTRSTRQRK